MRTIRMLHGIHTSKNSRRLQGLASVVAEESGMLVRYHEYGDIWALQTRYLNPKIAERLRREIEPGDILAGHSNGCAIWLRCLMLGAPARGLVLLNPALADDTDFGLLPNLEFIHVYFNDHDGAVPWAARSPKILTDPLWGDMGRDGYKGMDWRVRQWDCGHTSGMPELQGHSAILDRPESVEWARFWAGKVREHLRPVYPAGAERGNGQGV